MRKPKLLIIGHARHGKDTFAELIAPMMGLKFSSSSWFVCERFIWPSWGAERYDTIQQCFEDRVDEKNRIVWANLISAWNTPDKTRTAKTMLDEGNDMYVGMRKMDEYNACIEAGLFDHVIWVDASKRLKKENKGSMELIEKCADIFIDNNGPEELLKEKAKSLQKWLHEKYFDVGFDEPVEAPKSANVIVGPGGIAPEEFQEPEIEDRLEWTDAPHGATPVLDHGFIQVKGVFGTDAEICEAARMSYGRGTKKVNNDEGLINYLVAHHHTSPLEMAAIKWHMRLPIFGMRQMVRHRTAKLNEYSGRYSEMVRLFYIPELDQIKGQDTVNRQGSDGVLPAIEAESVQQGMRQTCNIAFDTYEELLRRKVSRETARIVLPLNTYTEVVWQMDISNLVKFLFLRDDPHAQYEIRVYAQEIAKAVEQHFPLVYAAYLKQRGRVNLSQEQIQALIDQTSISIKSNSEAKVVEDLLEKHKNAGLD